MMKIRKAAQDDADAVRDVHLAAFPEDEGELVARLAVDLLSEEAALVRSLVAQIDGVIVGHVAFSPVMDRGTGERVGSILAPLAVSPDHQKRGVASHLIKDGIEYLSGLCSGILLVYGDPDFYGRFGFRVDVAECYTPPHPLQYAFGWQGMVLGDVDPRSSAISISCVPPLADPALW